MQNLQPTYYEKLTTITTSLLCWPCFWSNGFPNC